jgi:hypothetical protein
MARPEMRLKKHAAALSRRELLRVGSLLVPAATLVPGIFTRVAHAQTPPTFDYYIAPNGSDSNPGTGGSPWAITAINSKRSTYSGKRVGLLNGTYNVGFLMSTTRDAPALNIDGGSSGSPTFIGAVNARQAIITANNGSYGGGNGNQSSMLAHNKSVPHQGYVTVDGLVLSGASTFCFEVGNYDFTNNALPGVVLQNCEITGNSAANSSVASGVNLCVIALFKATGFRCHNCYIHDNFGWSDASHFSATYVWQSQGTTFEYCTLVNTGGLHGKEAANQGTTIQYNYIDWTNGPTGQNGACIMGFDGAPQGGLTQTTSIHNNILLGNDEFMDLEAELNNGGWTTPVLIYNNTMISTSGISDDGVRWFEQNPGSRLLKFYNNLFFDSGHAPGGYGYVIANSGAFALCDYNCYGGSSRWTLVPPGSHSSAGANTYSSLSAWQAAISADAHSQNGVAAFSNGGALAQKYRVTSGLAYQAGKVGGVSSGATVNIGAWDGIATQIGSSTTGGVTIPDPPILSVS